MHLPEFKDGHVNLNPRQTIILLGKIKFDDKYEKFATSFGLNPLREAATISGKPNHLDVKAIENMKNFDENILRIVKTTGSPAYRRHVIPITESQNYGWNAPLMTYDRSKMMFNYGRQRKLFYK